MFYRQLTNKIESIQK